MTRIFAKLAVIVCAIFGLAWQACAASPEGMKLYIFTSQPLDIAKSALSSAATGDEKILIPVAFFLIRHPKGNILFDTGDNDRIITDQTYWGPMAAMLDKGVSADLAIDTQLGKLGIKPTDINYVILGHMHLDHAGNVGKFPSATRSSMHSGRRRPMAVPISVPTLRCCALRRVRHRLADNRRSSSMVISICSETAASTFIGRLAILPEAK